MNCSRNILYLGVVILIIGCERPKCTSAPPPVLIRFVSTTGVDLLNPVNPNSFTMDYISLTYLHNGNPMNMACSIQKIPGTDSFYLATDIGWYADMGRTFFLKLNNADTDTIYARVDGIGCGFEAKEFRYNNEPVQLKNLLAGVPPVYEIRK